VSPQLAGRDGVFCADSDTTSVVPAGNTFGLGQREWRLIAVVSYAIDPEAAGRLWIVSEEMTGTRFEG